MIKKSKKKTSRTTKKRVKREVALKRKTKETDISVSLKLDGKGNYKIDVDIPFLRHMLELFAKHSMFDLKLSAKGDIDVDIHHTNEDIGILLGEAFLRALGDKRGIRRFATSVVPMDEVLVRAVTDISGRACFAFDYVGSSVQRFLKQESSGYRIGDAIELWKTFTSNAKIALHVDVLKAKEQDPHHILEAIFKAIAVTLRYAVKKDKGYSSILPSTKGEI